MTAPMTAEELQAEIVEQCRLNAMGQERAAKLLAEVERLRKALLAIEDRPRKGCRFTDAENLCWMQHEAARALKGET